jgi:hypothetical protein
MELWGVDAGGGGGGSGGAPGEVEPRFLAKVGEGTHAGGEPFADDAAEPFASSYVRFIFIDGDRIGGRFLGFWSTLLESKCATLRFLGACLLSPGGEPLIMKAKD